MDSADIRYKKNVLNPWSFLFGMIRKLPSVIWWNIKVIHIDQTSCQVTIPYSWRTQNPFKSIYFAALAGAGELSTGALCQMYLAGRVPHAMLAVGLKAEFVKKADSTVTFSCNQGKELMDLLDSLYKKGDTGQITMESIGVSASGDKVAKIYVTWSFKRKA